MRYSDFETDGEFLDCYTFIETIQKIYKTEITPHTTIQQFAASLNLGEKFYEIYEERKELAANWKLSLDIWINDITSVVYFDEDNETNNLLIKFYRAFLVGEKIYLFNVCPDLSLFENVESVVTFIVDKLIKAYQYAHYLDELIEERDGISEVKQGFIYQPKNDTNKIDTKKIDPIIWTSDKVLLGFLIQWLKDNHFISKTTARDNVINNHFVDEAGNPIKNIRQLLQGMRDLNDGKLPQKYEKLEPLLNDLKDMSK